MLDILIIIHLVVCVLLVAVILLQRTSSDTLSGLGSSGNSGLMTQASASSFLGKTTAILAFIFMANSVLMANVSGKLYNKEEKKIEKIIEEDKIPIAE